MERIKFRKSLGVLTNENTLANAIVADIKESMVSINLDTLMYDGQFMVDICKSVNKNEKKMISRKIWSLQKKNVVLKVYTILYGESVDLHRIGIQINFVKENHLIARKSLIRMFLEMLNNFF